MLNDAVGWEGVTRPSDPLMAIVFGQAQAGLGVAGFWLLSQ
jgi:hypothetical protein